VKRRAAYAKRFGRGRHISIRPCKRPLKNPALRLGEDFGTALRPTKQIGSGDRLLETHLRDSKRQSS
jgi:hypothetical protein